MRTIWLASSLLLALSVFAQQGHPLSGTWTGDWGPNPTQRTHVTIVMDWDGKQVTGQINPGPDSVPLASVFVDVTNWTVRIEAVLSACIPAGAVWRVDRPVGPASGSE